MSKKQKERILKMIEVYRIAFNLDLDCSIDICKDESLCVIRVEDMLAYLDWLSFDERIKEMEEYIKGVKSEVN